MAAAAAALIGAAVNLGPKALSIIAGDDSDSKELKESKAKLRQVQQFLRTKTQKGYSQTQLQPTIESANALADLYQEAAQAHTNHLQNMEALHSFQPPPHPGVLAVKWASGTYAHGLEEHQQAINTEMNLVLQDEPESSETPAPSAAPQYPQYAPFKQGHQVKVLSVSSHGWCGGRVDYVTQEGMLGVSYVGPDGTNHQKEVPPTPEVIQHRSALLGTCCAVGDAVEYFSFNNHAWFPSEVTCVHHDSSGQVTSLDLKGVKNNADARQVLKLSGEVAASKM